MGGGPPWLIKEFPQCYYPLVLSPRQSKSIITYSSIDIPYRMSTPQTSLFTCSSCQASYDAEDLYKEHYKSEHHRYNLKRKIINLPPLTYSQYVEQFESIRSSASSTADFKCEICNKTFVSPNTYSHHLNSKKHKNTRKRIMDKSSAKSLSKSGSQSSSNFSIISHNHNHSNLIGQKCLFCNSGMSDEHLKSHSFPPFKYNCSDYPGLVKRVKEIIESHTCLYCEAEFSCLEGVQKHMVDAGHARIDTDNFGRFEEFYNWTIKEEEDENDNQEEEWEVIKEHKETGTKITLEDLEKRRKERVVFTNIGAKINGRLVGLRAYKKFYNQYYRPIIRIDRTTKALTNFADKAPVTLPVATLVPPIRA